MDIIAKTSEIGINIPINFVPLVEEKEGGGASANSYEKIEKIEDDRTQVLRNYALYSCSTLKEVSFSNCTIVGNYAFANCSAISNISLPNCTIAGIQAFANCSSISQIDLPNCKSIWTSAFLNCSSLQLVNLPNCVNISGSAFQSCKSLSAFVVKTSDCVLSQLAFQSTPMTSSGLLGRYGSIYVPSSYVSKYKNATNWIAYSSRIAAIEGTPFEVL